MTEAEALARVEQLINGTVAVLDPKPQLEVVPTSMENSECGSDGDAEGRISVGREYYLRGIPKGRIDSVAQQVKRYWDQQGYRVEGVSKSGRSITARSAPDDFFLALGAAGDDALVIGASSTCVLPN
ncbi:hypothetical protein ACFFWE_16810 [Sphaerisporangium melleum]|uniref:Uncharacterized protein n=1 Tax=Sphaerisporangium melleum TaxID=321316 RepID=A0A917VI67_9ACTN|nr:hypothetical protein [Sphaerisporangium melleum]GGK81032.1 hypothetical protein GCM10007964_24630 [Sphaerisporangium melleum]